MRRLLPILLLAATPSFAQARPAQAPAATQPSKPADPLSSLDFLLGTWVAKTNTAGTAGADSSGTYTFTRDLAGHALQRTSSLDKCTGPKGFSCSHHDQLTVFSDLGTLNAFYIDSEGHVIHYSLTTPDAHTAIFDSQGPPAAPHFRLSYHLEGPTMFGKFQFAPPGSTDYRSYLEWSGIKQ